MTRVISETLTPERVRSAVFSLTRLGRRGVDEGEVRAFCDWVSDGLGRLLSDNAGLQEEVMRLRNRLIAGDNAGPQPEDAHVQAVYVLSRAQQTADRYVADAQEYSRELAQDASLRRDEVLREAKVRASMILEEAHTAASQAAASMVSGPREPLPAAERQELQAEITYLRTFSDVCRTHLRAYMESLSRSIEQWEQVERKGAAARQSVLRSPERV